METNGIENNKSAINELLSNRLALVGPKKNKCDRPSTVAASPVQGSGRPLTALPRLALQLNITLSTQEHTHPQMKVSFANNTH